MLHTSANSPLGLMWPCAVDRMLKFSYFLINPSLRHPDVTLPGWQNVNLINPSLRHPDVTLPGWQNVNLINPTLHHPDVTLPGWQNVNLINPTLHHPDVTLSGWQDVKLQLLTDPLCVKYRGKFSFVLTKPVFSGVVSIVGTLHHDFS